MICNISKKENSLLGKFGGWTNSRSFQNCKHHGVMLEWNVENFQQYSFDILAMLKGEYIPGIISSKSARGSEGWVRAGNDSN